jgi:hypothetical protein
MKSFFRIASLAIIVWALAGGFSWVHAQCPEDTVDRGTCDTLTMACLDCEQTPGTGPWQVRFPLLVTHDQTVPDDSIAGFVIPLGWTRTNPAAYCSLDAYWNATSTLWVFPDFSRSVFRHILNESDPTDTLMRNRMAQIGGDFSNRDWDTRVVEVSTDEAYARMSIVATGTQDQGWWEGDRILLATLTFVIEDTMTICIDSAFWPPTGRLLWSRADSKTYIPRSNLPHCFTVGPPPAPDFTIEASPDTQTVEPGQSTDYTVTLTSVAGFNSPCTLTVTGLPAGASESFAPNPVIPTNTSTMSVSTTGATPEGFHTLTVTASELPRGQVEHSTQVVLEVLPSQSITVTAPDGGEEWCASSSQSIAWAHSSIDMVKIEYSTNTGSNWVTEVASTPAAPGTYSWIVPNAPSQQCLVRICDAQDGTPCDQSNGLFTIKGAPATPSGCAASEDVCDTVRFCWSDNSGDETGFYIYREGTKLDSVGAGVTCYDDLSASPAVSYQYCVSAYNECGESGQCCDNGSVAQEAILVTAPNGGEDWSTGTSQDITWNSDCLDTVRIEYSTNTGSNWITEVEKTAAAPGTYSWSVPYTPSQNCLVRICDAEDGTPCDQSDDVFTISCLGDFTIEAVQPRRKLLAGNSIDYQVALTSLDGFASPCTLTATGLPADAGADFDPNPIAPTDTAVMTISTLVTTPLGLHEFTITGSEIGGCEIEHSTQASLLVSVAEPLVVTALHSGVDLTVTDPAGSFIGPENSTIPEGTYESAVDEDGDIYDQVTIPSPLRGEYLIEVVREPDATDADVFTLFAEASGREEVVLAANLPVPPAGQPIGFVFLNYMSGDANGDYEVDLGDVVFLVTHLYKKGPSPEPISAGDANGDGTVDVGDIVYLLTYILRNGPPPQP